MKIETTPMDDLWIGIITVAVLYLVMRTIQTLERISKKVDSMVDHIGAEVDSAISRLSKEANGIIHNLEKNAFSYKNHLVEHVQGVELQCYRAKNGIAFGFGPRTVKKKSSAIPPPTVQPVLQMKNPNTTTDATHPAEPEKHQLLALHKCVDKIVRKYKWPFVHHKHRNSMSRQQQCQETQSPTVQETLLVS